MQKTFGQMCILAEYRDMIATHVSQCSKNIKDLVHAQLPICIYATCIMKMPPPPQKKNSILKVACHWLLFG